MKAKLNDEISLLVALEGNYEKLLPVGTRGVVLECYEKPEGYIVDLWIPDATQIGGNRYDCITVLPEQIEVVLD